MASPNTLWHVGRPRRRSSLSSAGRSSWISEYVCSISSAAPNSSMPAGSDSAIMRPASMQSTGRSRLPPANTLCRIALWMETGCSVSSGISRSRAASVSRCPCSKVSLSMNRQYNKGKLAPTPRRLQFESALKGHSFRGCGKRPKRVVSPWKNGSPRRNDSPWKNESP